MPPVNASSGTGFLSSDAVNFPSYVLLWMKASRVGAHAGGSSSSTKWRHASLGILHVVVEGVGLGLLPGDIGQCWDTFLVVITWGGCYWLPEWGLGCC